MLMTPLEGVHLRMSPGVPFTGASPMKISTSSVAMPPGANVTCGLREEAVQAALGAPQAGRVTPLGSDILDSPAPPISAKYRSPLNISKELTPRPSLVEPIFTTVGVAFVAVWAFLTFMTSPDFR